MTGGSPFTIPTYPDQVADLATGTEDIQTFYLTDRAGPTWCSTPTTSSGSTSRPGPSR